MSQLSDLVAGLKREVAVPGTFDDVFPNTTNADLQGTLLDAFAQVQLDGFLLDHEASDSGEITPDLSRGLAALVVIYAGVRILTLELINRKSHTRYEASGAVFEQDQGASILTQALKDLAAKKASILQLARSGGTGVVVYDAYFIKATDFSQSILGEPDHYALGR